MKLRGIQVSEAIYCLLYSTRLAEVTWEALSIVRLVLSGGGRTDKTLKLEFVRILPTAGDNNFTFDFVTL